MDITVVEFCPHCEHEAEIVWDVRKMGFKAFCPVCGKKLMLCSECMSEENGTGACDWCRDTNSCYRERLCGEERDYCVKLFESRFGYAHVKARNEQEANMKAKELYNSRGIDWVDERLAGLEAELEC